MNGNDKEKKCVREGGDFRYGGNDYVDNHDAYNAAIFVFFFL